MAAFRSSASNCSIRGTRRAHHLALATAHRQRVDNRLLLTLWHLAERWGRGHTDGVVVPLPLSHQRLADLVGAHGPSVTTAMGELARAWTISRRDGGEWVLDGDPEESPHHNLVAALSSRPPRRGRRAAAPPPTDRLSRAGARARGP
jgi:CRP/FNR family transcriptional regulator, cyclic AMP receptor protein